MSGETTWLRKQPRQQRAIDRVETLLDTAAVVFHELGMPLAPGPAGYLGSGPPRLGGWAA